MNITDLQGYLRNRRQALNEQGKAAIGRVLMLEDQLKEERATLARLQGAVAEVDKTMELITKAGGTNSPEQS